MNFRKRLILVSNRLPVTIQKRKEKLVFHSSVGGLATGLSSLSSDYDITWIGWCGVSSNSITARDKDEIGKKLIQEFQNMPIFLDRKTIELYYRGFCNKTLWPILHSFTQYVVYEEKYWKAYRRVNELFLKKILETAKPEDIIWIHDYHLALLPKLLRKKINNLKLGFFLHTPFPPSEIFRLLPWRKEILEGMLNSNLIGFHTYDYVHNFLRSVSKTLGYNHNLGQIRFDGKLTKVDSFPMGIDYQKFKNAVESRSVQKEVKRIQKKTGKRKIILSMDRLDYTKGVLNRLCAYDLFLKEYPDYREKVTFIQIAVPSRTKVEHYQDLKKKLEVLVSNINGKYGKIGWTPIWYMYRSLPFYKLVALYNVADIALITPLKDGMNLMAKEFVATKNSGHGVLVLSETAGAVHELGEAIIVNPNNVREIEKAIVDGLTMAPLEQLKRNKVMQNRLKRYDLSRWVSDFLDNLKQSVQLHEKRKAHFLIAKTETKIVKDFLNNKERLLLLDYDGTLTPFEDSPEKAKPEKDLSALLEKLAHKAEVVLISGRDKQTLEKWFGSLDINLIAEHGAWIKSKNSNWKATETLSVNWKNEIRPILELYVDRTPRSFIEEKTSSLVWHFRNVDPQLASVRAMELRNLLHERIGTLPVGILQGDKVVEVKNVSANKGRAAERWLSKKNWNFILAIGDDRTDEDMFKILPKSAFSIKVGFGLSEAQFNVHSSKDVRSLLDRLT